MKTKLGCISQCFWPRLLYCQNCINQAEWGRLATCHGLINFICKVLAKGGIVPPSSGAALEDGPSYSGWWQLALVQLFSALLQLTQAGEVLVTEVV